MGSEFEPTLSKDKEKDSRHGRKPNQRMKHIFVLHYLMEYSDEQHPVRLEDLKDTLKENGIPAERKALYKDIEEINIVQVMAREGVTFDKAVQLLQEDPDEYQTVKYKKKHGYYVAKRSLELDDARLLAECVQTARFVTARESEALVEGLGSFLSEHQRDAIQHEPFAVAREKTNSAQVFGNVDTIHAAMAQSADHAPEKIRFKYLKCTIQNVNELVKRRHGEFYIVSPHAIMINEGNYYLLGIDDKSKQLRTYRIDRMTHVRAIGEAREGNAETENLKEYLTDYYRRVFSMYGGRRELVCIRFPNSLLDTVVDRFGDYATYLEEDKRHFVVSVAVEISPMFFGWLCGFGNKSRLLSPSPVIEEFTKHLAKMQELYQ